MKKALITLGAVLLLGLAVLAVARMRGTEKKADTDLEAVRADLKEQLASGELSEAEAQVRFAEAYAESKQPDGKKGRPKLSPELEALGAEIKEQMKKGELTEAEAEARWIEAKKQVGAEGKDQSKAGAGTKPRPRRAK